MLLNDLLKLWPDNTAEYSLLELSPHNTADYDLLKLSPHNTADNRRRPLTYWDEKLPRKNH